MRYWSSALLYVDPCAKLAMLLDGSTAWPSQDLTWRTRFVVESSLHLRLRIIEGFLWHHEIEWAEEKGNRDLHVTNKFILYDIVLHKYNWHLEVVITSWGPIFDLGFYMKGRRCQKKVGMTQMWRLTENFFIRFICGILSLFKCWVFRSNLARSFTCRRWFSCSLSACALHAWRNGSMIEFSVNGLTL